MLVVFGIKSLRKENTKHHGHGRHSRRSRDSHVVYRTIKSSSYHRLYIPTYVVNIMTTLQFVRLFVYGTLKSGEPNHYILSDRAIGKARLITKAKTKQKYPLVVASDFNLPFMLPVPGKGEVICDWIVCVCGVWVCGCVGGCVDVCVGVGVCTVWVCGWV